jgi:hypothetical protein
VARHALGFASIADIIAMMGGKLTTANTLDEIGSVEADGARVYWSAWRELPVRFPRADLVRTPEHWRTFGPRRSPLSGGTGRRAVTPGNAMANYLYAILESEARLSAAALGLDPGLGFLHVDSGVRDSLACDLMEAARPACDEYLARWLLDKPLRRDWFFEDADGTCRLTSAFAVELSKTAPMWARAIAPWAERITAMLSGSLRRGPIGASPPTRLTQRNRRAVHTDADAPEPRPVQTPTLCQDCGTPVRPGRSFCVHCGVIFTTKQFRAVAAQGRALAHSPTAQSHRAATQRRNRATELAWKPSEQPRWLTEDAYRSRILPKLATISVSRLATVLVVSLGYAQHIKRGLRRPHPRHWVTLARLVGLSQ